MGLWKEILKEASWVKHNWKFRVGNGTKVRFWTDFWCGPSALSHSFPSLFKVVDDKSITMVEAWNHLDDGGDWNLNCVRAFNDWEINLVANLLPFKRKGFPLRWIELSRKGQHMQPSQCAMPIAY